MTPDAFFRHTLRKVRSNQLEPALMQLPFDYVTALLTRLESAGKGGADAELMARAALVVVRLHHSRLSTTAAALPLLRSLRASTKRALQVPRSQETPTPLGPPLVPRHWALGPMGGGGVL